MQATIGSGSECFGARRTVEWFNDSMSEFVAVASMGG